MECVQRRGALSRIEEIQSKNAFLEQLSIGVCLGAGLLKTHNCGICGMPLAGGSLARRNRSHFETVHPEYLSWYSQWVKRLVLVSSLLLVLPTLGNYYALSTANLLLLVSVNLVYALSVSAMLLKLSMGFREFKHRWRQEHGTGPAR